jgi:hypothetical protein
VGLEVSVPGAGESVQRGEITARDNGYWKSGRGTILKVIELFKDGPLHTYEESPCDDIGLTVFPLAAPRLGFGRRIQGHKGL